MNPEKEWEYEQKLDYLSFKLEELVLEVFISVLEKLKDRNEPLEPYPKKHLEDEIEF